MTTEQKPRFRLGRCTITQSARDWLDQCSINPEVLVRRHAAGVWGDIPEEDYVINDDAVKNGGRILSGYAICGRMVWVITDKERRSTMVCLPPAY